MCIWIKRTGSTNVFKITKFSSISLMNTMHQTSMYLYTCSMLNILNTQCYYLQSLEASNKKRYAIMLIAFAIMWDNIICICRGACYPSYVSPMSFALAAGYCRQFKHVCHHRLQAHHLASLPLPFLTSRILFFSMVKNTWSTSYLVVVFLHATSSHSYILFNTPSITKNCCNQEKIIHSSDSPASSSAFPFPSWPSTCSVGKPDPSPAPSTPFQFPVILV
jgi:hypothetical protein